ncbi:SusC/RagA family TonB-linked outer membrane protein [Fulvitalea axinellae]|uniref:SusC/RagA family TonB-linked outer membrane protein n=1 Tax=Fulvitalea axinellae TaxID=1182444 RepID=A0AAU9DD41_9BACT|nr:SusC/RagA family TonB-linked outer membrane protein [Fulvitalea axinellae]
MNKKVLLLSLILTLFSSFAWAQGKTVTGTVISEEDGEPIPGVNVQVKGKTAGTITDFEGQYTVVVSDGDILTFSFIGLATQEVEIGNRSKIDVTMSADLKKLDEVIVTAIGIKREERSLGYSATAVKSEALTEAAPQDVMSALKGKVAGLQISSAGGAPGSSSNVLLRGMSTITGSNQPLYVVDGVPMYNGTSGASSDLNAGVDFANGANAVNPNDVASVTVLKGSSATALYGSRGANGVILITTKNGKTGDRKKAQISFNSSVQFSNPLKFPEYQKKYGQGWQGHAAPDENTSWGDAYDGKPRVWGNVVDNEQRVKPYEFVEDNVKDFYETGTTYSNSLSLGAGDDEMNYYFSYGNVNADGTYPTDVDSYVRHNFSLRGGAKLTEKLSVRGSFNYVKTEQSVVSSGQGTSVLNGLWQIPADIPISELKDYNNKFNDLEGYFTPYGLLNPYFVLDNFGNELDANRYFGNFQFEYAIKDNLRLSWKVGTDISERKVRRWSPKLEIAGPNSGQNSPGSYSESRYRDSELNSDLLLTYNKNFGDDFEFTGIVGWNMNQRETDGITSSITNLSIPGFYHLSNSGDAPEVTQTSSKIRSAGVFASADLGYKDILFMSLTGRQDWSSTLPSSNNTFFYPGVNLGFVFSDAFGISDYVDYGKIRMGWARTGNAAPAYRTLTTFTQASHDNGFTELTYPWNGLNGYSLSNRAGNEDLKNEMTTEWELGADLRFFDNRLGIDFTYYNKVIEDLILDRLLPATSGYTVRTENTATVRNKGVEILVTATPVETDNFRWETSVNFAKNNNEVEKLSGESDEQSIGGLSSLSFIAKVGQPLGLYKGIGPKRTKDGKVIVDASTGRPIKSSEPEILGSSQVDFTMGWTNRFSYKNFTLGATVDMSRGGVMYSRTKDIMLFTGNGEVTGDRENYIVPNSVYLDSETGEYVENDIALSHDGNNLQKYWSEGGVDLAGGGLIDKDFIKLREVSLTYTLPQSLLSKTPFNSLQLSAVGRDLFLITADGNVYSDPEQSTFGAGSDILRMYGDYGAQLSNRSYGFSLKATF